MTRGLSPHTLRNYRTDLGHFLRWLSERGIELAGLGRRDYRDYLATLREAEMAEASIRRRASTIKSFVRRLHREGQLPTDPLELASTPKTPAQLPKSLALHEIDALLEAPDRSTPAGLRDRAMLEVLYSCGVRVSELTGMRVGDYDPDAMLFVVRGKGDKERAVLLGDPAERALRDYLHAGRPALTGEQVNQWLWLNRFGKRLSSRAVQLRVRRYAAEAGLGRTCIRICCDTHSPRICSMEAPISASFRSCWGTRVSRRPSCIRTSPSAASEPPSKTPWTGYRSCCASGGRNERPPMRVEPSRTRPCGGPTGGVEGAG